MLDIRIEDDRWAGIDLERIAHEAVGATLEFVSLDREHAEVSLMACDDRRIAELNADFRRKPAPTNVLSWPAEDLAADTPGTKPLPPNAGPDDVFALGDVAIAFETCEREAAELDKPLAEHTFHLIVHGTLHLLGYDHIHDLDATLMQGAERKILGKMGYDDPYYSDDAASPQ